MWSNLPLFPEQASTIAGRIDGLRIGNPNALILLANSHGVTPPWVVGRHNERCALWPAADRHARRRSAPHGSPQRWPPVVHGSWRSRETDCAAAHRPSPLGQGALHAGTTCIQVLALIPRCPRSCCLQGLILLLRRQLQPPRPLCRVGAPGAALTPPTGRHGTAHSARLAPGGEGFLLPAARRCALWPLDGLRTPVPRARIARVGPGEARVPTRVGTRRAAPRNPTRVTTRDQQRGVHGGRLHQGLPRRQVVGQQRRCAGLGTRRVVPRRSRRRNVGQQGDGLGLTGLRDVHQVPRPLGGAGVARARLSLIGRCALLGRRGQLSRGFAPHPAGLPLGPGGAAIWQACIVLLPHLAPRGQARQGPTPLGGLGRRHSIHDAQARRAARLRVGVACRLALGETALRKASTRAPRPRRGGEGASPLGCLPGQIGAGRPPGVGHPCAPGAPTDGRHDLGGSGTLLYRPPCARRRPGSVPAVYRATSLLRGQRKHDPAPHTPPHGHSPGRSGPRRGDTANQYGRARPPPPAARSGVRDTASSSPGPGATAARQAGRRLASGR